MGTDEREDPLHFAPSIIREIARAPRQEIGTHTFSHYYCLEPGQDVEAFRADLQAASSIAREFGVTLSSLVFPRNQCNANYLPVLKEVGIRCYRGTQQAWMYRPVPHARDGAARRAGRILDAYAPLYGDHLIRWEHAAPRNNGVACVPASFFLRPYVPALRRFERLRRARLRGAIRHAARTGRICHIWWHPHNFGHNLTENLDFLSDLLDEFAQQRRQEGMLSLSMCDVVTHVQN